MYSAIHSFYVVHPVGSFIGIVAFDSTCMVAIDAARRTWGSLAEYKELNANELLAHTKKGCAVLTASVQFEEPITD